MNIGEDSLVLASNTSYNREISRFKQAVRNSEIDQINEATPACHHRHELVRFLFHPSISVQISEVTL
jgi:hypothetical protein